MEILAEYTARSNFEIIAIVVATILGALFIVAALACASYGATPTIFYAVLGLLCLSVWITKPNTYYDAIITDWNEVYSQGYEVVGTNGKIVTLRKVDE